MGRTEDGQPVIGDWFPMVNSEGIPLEIILSFFKNQGLVPSWTSFIDSAVECGWNMGSLRTKIYTATGDVYGPDYRDEVIKRFDLYTKRK